MSSILNGWCVDVIAFTQSYDCISPVDHDFDAECAMYFVNDEKLTSR